MGNKTVVMTLEGFVPGLSSAWFLFATIYSAWGFYAPDIPQYFHYHGNRCRLFGPIFFLRYLRRKAEWDLEDNVDIHWRAVARGGLELPRLHVPEHCAFDRGG